jgi:hypothetical protein
MVCLDGVLRTALLPAAIVVAANESTAFSFARMVAGTLAESCGNTAFSKISGIFCAHNIARLCSAP